MKFTFSIIKSLVSVCLIFFTLSTPTRFSLSQNSENHQTFTCKSIQDQRIKNNEKLEEIARKISVNIFPENFENNYGASGFLIAKQLQNNREKKYYQYLVLTNAHVLESLKKRVLSDDSRVIVKTFDNQINLANLYPLDNSQSYWQGNDLGLLWFGSLENYEIADIGCAKQLAVHENVFVSGFPCENQTQNACNNKFLFTQGVPFLELIQSNRHLDSGYQLGLTNDTKEGMSGGPVLNQYGQVVGIHGRGKYQERIFSSGSPRITAPNPLAYMTGEEPPPETQERFREFSWALPIETYQKYKPKKLFGFLKDRVPITTVQFIQSNKGYFTSSTSSTVSSSNTSDNKERNKIFKTLDPNFFFLLAIVLFFVIVPFILIFALLIRGIRNNLQDKVPTKANSNTNFMRKGKSNKKEISHAKSHATHIIEFIQHSRNQLELRGWPNHSILTIEATPTEIFLPFSPSIFLQIRQSRNVEKIQIRPLTSESKKLLNNDVFYESSQGSWSLDLGEIANFYSHTIMLEVSFPIEY